MPDARLAELVRPLWARLAPPPLPAYVAHESLLQEPVAARPSQLLPGDHLVHMRRTRGNQYAGVLSFAADRYRVLTGVAIYMPTTGVVLTHRFESPVVLHTGELLSVNLEVTEDSIARPVAFDVLVREIQCDIDDLVSPGTIMMPVAVPSFSLTDA